jgi:hypothetical protein
MTEDDIIKLIMSDPWRVQVLETAAQLGLKDWWIASGFVRNPVWDQLSGKPTASPLNDIDMIYFEPSHNKADEVILEEKANKLLQEPWSIRNQCRMHLKNGDEPYTDSVDGMVHWIETVASVAIKLNENGNPVFLSVFDLNDLTSQIIRPTPHCRTRKDREDAYHSRVKDKKWDVRWPGVTIIPFETC